MMNCPKCQPSDIACLKHCPKWVLDLMPLKMRREILKTRKKMARR